MSRQLPQLYNVETLREHAKAMEKQAKSLNEDYVNQQQYKMNKVWALNGWNLYKVENWV